MAKKEMMTTKNDTELEKLLADTRAALRAERFAAAGSRPKDPSQAAKQRALIARVLTEQRARVLKASAQ